MDILNFIAGAGTMLVGVIVGACVRRMDDTKKQDESEGVLTNVYHNHSGSSVESIRREASKNSSL